MESHSMQYNLNPAPDLSGQLPLGSDDFSVVSPAGQPSRSDESLAASAAVQFPKRSSPGRVHPLSSRSRRLLPARRKEGFSVS